MCTLRSVEGHSSNHDCCANAINIAYSEFVSVASGIQRAKRTRCIVSTCGLPDSTVFFPHYLKKSRFSETMLLNLKSVTCYLTILLIGSTCFGHYYVHHQELATIMLITTLVVPFLVCCMLEVKCA